jgi:protein SCO1/2
VKATPLAIALLMLLPSAAGAVDPHSFNELAFRQHPGAQLPLDSEIVDEQGRGVRLANAFNGRPVIFVLEYLRCANLCSLVLSGATAGLRDAGLTPGKQVDLVAVSIDPRDTARDAAAASAMYSRRFNDPSAAGGIRFFTAPPGEVARIAAVVGFPYRFDRQSGQFAHPAGFVVATPSGRIARYVLGMNPSPVLLQQAIAEASHGTIEPPAHPLLLLCFGYDPDEGTAAALAMQVVQWASLGVVFGCALLVGWLSLRRRQA